MLSYIAIAIALGWLFIGGWLGWQLLRQNGRTLLRLDELEKRLDTLELGEDDAPEGLAVGTEAPAFELPDLTGEHTSLVQFRGQPVLLIFFNPDCGYCREMMSRLAEVVAGLQPAVGGGILPPGMSTQPSESPENCNRTEPSDANSAWLEARLNGRQGCLPPQLLIISAGGVEKNRQLFAEHKVNCPVLLQTDSEVAAAYHALGTPSGYLIDPGGKISSQLAMGAEALMALVIQARSDRADESPASSLQPSTLNSQPESESRFTSAATAKNGHASRFDNRSLANSKIKRDGLKAGTPAPEFQLPRLNGKGDLSLRELRGKRVLLIFSSPGCGPCNALAPELEKFHREHPEIELVMISKGDPKENRAKVREHGLTFPIVLQQQWEISRRYAMFATPIAYLIDESGLIARDVAVGVEPILELLSASKNQNADETDSSLALLSAA